MVRVAPINLTFNPRTLWFDPGDLDIEKDMPVVVRTARGTEFGIAASEVIEVSEEQVRALKSALRPVERIATEEDIEQAAEMERASAEALPVFKEMAREYHEDMHPVSVEFLLDGDKAVFYFEAEERIDFRELVRKLAARFHVRIDLRQIGGRDPGCAWWAASGTAARSCAASDSAASSAPCPSAWPRSRGSR